MEKTRWRNLIIDYHENGTVGIAWWRVKGRAETMIQLVGGESGFPRARKPRRRKIEARPSTKVASTSLKRVTEAEPTFASAWNRATRGSFSRGIGQGTGTPAYFSLPKMRKPWSVVSRPRKRQPDNDSIRILLRVRITRIEGREIPSIIQRRIGGNVERRVVSVFSFSFSFFFSYRDSTWNSLFFFFIFLILQNSFLLFRLTPSSYSFDFFIENVLIG